MALSPISDLLNSCLGGPNTTSRGPRQKIDDVLVSRNVFTPFPSIDDRVAWNSLSPTISTELIRRGDEVAGTEWPSLTAARYLDYSRDGNRSRFSDRYFDRRQRVARLLFAECCDDSNSRLDDLINGIWLICEETSWCVPAHIWVQRSGIGLPDVNEPIVDLFAAETGALLAWILYLVRPRLEAVSPLIVLRLEHEIIERILKPCNSRDDFWWMGFGERKVNNWNPWINSNWLTALLLVADEATRLDGLVKSVRSIDRFVGPYPSDGGCDEGPSYWGRAGASLFEYLELLSAALEGRFDPFALEIVREIGRFIYRVHIAESQFVNFADAPAVVIASGDLIERFGRHIDDAKLAEFGAWLVGQTDTKAPDPGLAGSPGRVLAALFGSPGDWQVSGVVNESPDSSSASAGAEGTHAPPLPRDVWFPDIQVMVARDREGDSGGWFLSAKGSHNAESHNHNDIGSFVVYRDGEPIVADAGVETYTKKTFSDDRYDIWTMQSAYHSLLPTINGFHQLPGRRFAATGIEYVSDDAIAELELDIAGAYPDSAGLKSWRKKIRLEREKGVVIEDQYEVKTPVSEIIQSILTPCDVTESKSGSIELMSRILPHGRRAGEATLRYDDNLLEASIERIAIDDAKLGDAWGDHLMRILFMQSTVSVSGSYRFEIG